MFVIFNKHNFLVYSTVDYDCLADISINNLSTCHNKYFKIEETFLRPKGLDSCQTVYGLRLSYMVVLYIIGNIEYLQAYQVLM